MLVYNSLQNYNKKSIYASKTYNFNKIILFYPSIRVRYPSVVVTGW